MEDSTYSMIKCQFIDCAWGMGFAGRGVCAAGGAWWMPCCPEYESEKDYLKRWEAESK